MPNAVSTLIEVSYKEEFLDLIYDLRAIENGVIFEKDDDEENILVKRIDAEKNMAYSLKAPLSYFDFSEDRIAFYDYEEFYQFFKGLMKSPDIKLDNTKIVMEKDNSRMDYMLSDPDSVRAGPKNIKFEGAQVAFKLTAKDLERLTKTVTSIKPKRAKISWDGKEVSIVVFSNQHHNVYEIKCDGKPIDGFDESFEFMVFFDVFIKLPSRRDYNVYLKTDGWSRYSLIHEEIDLDIYAGRVA